jgi:hypothetical protein
VGAVESDRSRVRRDLAREDVEERRLPRAVRADEAVHLGARDREMGAAQRVDAAKALVEPVDAEECPVARQGCQLRAAGSRVYAV